MSQGITDFSCTCVCQLAYCRHFMVPHILTPVFSLFIPVLMLLCSVGYGNTRDEVTSATPCNNIVNCFVDPCMFASCRAYPQATCQSNYCGGCNAEFFDASGSDVTALCGSATTTVPRLTLPPLTLPPLTVRPPASCPPPSTGFGLCVEQCSSDSACPFGQLCCSTGCGHLCMNGIATPSKPSQSIRSHVLLIRKYYAIHPCGDKL